MLGAWLLILATDIFAVAYTEIISQRLRFGTAQPPAVSLDWALLPFTDLVDVDASWVASSSSIASVSVQFQTNVGFQLLTNPLSANLGSKTKLIVASDGTLLGVATPTKLLLMSFKGNTGCPPSQAASCDVRTFIPPPWGTPLSTANSVDWYVGTTTGLYVFNHSTQNISAVDFVPRSSVTALTAWNQGLALSAADHLYFFQFQTQMWRVEWTSNTSKTEVDGGVIDGPALAMAFHSSSQSIFFGTCCSLSRLYLGNWTFERIGPMEGLPAANVQSLRVEESGRVWLATPSAVVIWESFKATDAWTYLSGPRFLPGTPVRALGSATIITDNGQPGAIVSTQSGMAVVVLDSAWTLQNKALLLESVRERHSRYGLVDSCRLLDFGVLKGCQTGPGDNDGLWTSLIVSAETFRWAATGDPEAHDTAWIHLRAMQMLNQVTGIVGLPARSVYQSATVPSGFPPTWQPSNASCCKGQWIWQGDTSSDEIIGHMFAYSTAYFLLAQNDAERTEIGSLLLNIINYIIENNFYLIDSNGKPTEWGRWNPKEVNFQRNFSDNRGINSLEIAAFIKSALRICPKSDVPKYTAALDALMKEGYNVNLLNAKVTDPNDDNYSDDELLFLVYGLYFMDYNHSYPLSDWDKNVMVSFQRAFETVRLERSAFWGSIYSASTGTRDLDLLRDIAWNLQTFPTEFINWPFSNSNRLDIHLRKEPGLEEPAQTEVILPYREGGLLVWNGNPFVADGGRGADGLTEASPAGFMLPFWMSSYFKLV